ncbi:hypothetical protein BH10BAC6_BH10BAC6_12660 [soil metagenome]
MRFVVAVIITLTSFIESQSCGTQYSRADMQLLLTSGSVRELEDLRTWFFTWNRERTVTSFDPSGIDAANNVDDWMHVLGATVKRTDVETILYKTSPEAFFTSMYGTSSAFRFPHNTFISFLVKPENSHVLKYIMLAKEMERLELSATWVYNREQHYTTVRELLEKGLEQHMATWLRQRYIYQWLRTYPPVQQVVQVLDREIGHTVASSTIHRWILLPYALALNGMQRPIDANLALCEVFDRCPSKRRRVLQLLNTDSSTLAKTFKRTSKRERIALLTMMAMRDPAYRLNAVRQVYQLDYTSRYWLFLATRELNKLEDHLSGWAEDDKRTLNLRDVRALESFLTSTMPTGSAEWDCYVGLMLAQCATLRHDHDEAIRRLTSIKHRPTLALEHQYSTMLAFHYIATDSIHDQRDAERLATLLVALNREPELSTDTTSKWVVSSLAQLASSAYARRGSIALAALYSTFGPTGEWIDTWEPVMTSAILKEVLSILHGTKLPTVAALLSTGTPPSIASVHELLSRAYSAEGRFAEAAASARVLEEQGIDGYEFVSDVNNLDPFYPRWVGYRRRIMKRWKASVLYDSLATLERFAKNKQTSCRRLLDRAHALYSITCFGSSWYLSRMRLSDDSYPQIAVPFWPSLFYSSLPSMSVMTAYSGSNNDYFLLERADKAYQKARDAAQTIEERSEAEFMLALCEENRSFFRSSADTHSSWLKPVKNGEHQAFVKYYRRYNNTSFAKRSFCPLLKAYTHWDYAVR